MVLEQTLARSGYLEELEKSDDPQDETRLENLAELVAVAREFADEPVPPPSADPADLTPARPGVPEFLERVALVADSDQIPDNDEGVVTLMTLHTAKGLEFPVVFLTGLEDGVFPHMRSLGDQPELEEERRLAYVGLTRAEQRLYVSRAVVRSAWGAPVAQPGVPLPRRAARPTWSTGGARRPSRRSWGRPVLPSLPNRNAGPPTRRFGTAAQGRRGGQGAEAGDPVTGAWRPRGPRLVRHGHGRHARGSRRQGGRLDRLRVAGCQAAAAALRARAEALT